MSERPATARARKEMRKDYSLVIFDCDGVLIDSEILSCDVLIEELALEGIVLDRDYVFRNCIGHSFPEVAQKIRQTSGKDLPEDFEARYRASLVSHFDSSLMPTAGVIEILERLRVPFCIATSSGKERAERSLTAAGLSRFDVPVFTASMVERGKPAPDLFLLAAERMGADPGKCLVLEDSIPGITAAKAAGMTVWRFAGGSHFQHGFGRGDPQLADGYLASWDDFFTVFPDLYRAR
jgi:HAD superfamily hydrolase (TIGR01509 family)